MEHGIALRWKLAVVVTGLVSLLAAPAVIAAEAQAPAPPPQEASTEQASDLGLELRLQTVKKDLLVMLNFAEHFIASGETKTAAQLQAPLDDYLRRHADYLVVQAVDGSNIEMTQLSAEIALVKTRLLIVLNYRDDAGSVLTDMKRLYAPYQKMSVQIQGKTTTLDEAIRQLDTDLARIAKK
ncbi:hypothetical protein M1B72_05800 [Geomonas paludis]|uniref:Uncharacterized protein n=1 Tax=Geomonas paludis TaxID=2740185 RepID=A0A6V8N1N2_9BACT|nr:hypothetical protein [Geomonas paludis]UPU37220.1 hypothetical protein M1B72_05800 [Geomonas paludis]GFO66362.1 hypothetical protein GMPD_42810 [Geomonas paludis]